MKMAMVNIDKSLPRAVITEKMSTNLTALLPLLSVRTTTNHQLFIFQATSAKFTEVPIVEINS